MSALVAVGVAAFPLLLLLVVLALSRLEDAIGTRPAPPADGTETQQDWARERRAGSGVRHAAA